MQYQVTVYYMDDKSSAIIIDREDVKKFMQCVKSDEPFFGTDDEIAFYTPLQQIRSLTMQRFQEENNEKKADSSSNGNDDQQQEAGRDAKPESKDDGKPSKAPKA